MNPHLLKEIEHFFQCIKILKKKVDVGGWGDVKKRTKSLKIVRFNQIENKPAGLFSIK
jgi:inorganic pyrophosphatase